MDNLGLTWVNERQTEDREEKGKDLILKEFSSFRTPLGDAVAAVIAPPGFYREIIDSEVPVPIWPEGHVAESYRGHLSNGVKE
ncbi:MAG: hypothetical protein D6690_17835 [Nitrospirae bacterium]|nr:MAG: hypothetical protein D6690_17835 [Nitrospirota bacterium]